MKLNKESQATLTTLAKFLKAIGGSNIEGYKDEAKSLTKGLTALRADIKALEAATTAEGGELQTHVDDNGTITGVGLAPVVPLTPPPEPVVATDPQPQFDQAGHVVVDGTVNSTELGQALAYELAFYVAPEQIAVDSKIVGRRPTAEGAFTLALYKQV